METLFHFRRTHCAKLALPDMGFHLQAFFDKLQGKMYEPVAKYTKVWRAWAHQITKNCTNHTTCYKRIMTGTGTNGTPKRCWSGTAPLQVEPVHRRGGFGSSWKETRNSPWSEARTMRIEGYEEAPSLFPEPVLAWFSLQKNGLEASKERDWWQQGTYSSLIWQNMP